MIYKIRQGQDIFDLNPGLHAVPEYSILTSPQMTFVCLMCDPSYDNPVGTLAGRPRREAAARIAGYKMEPDGKRLDKNGRMVVYGQIPSIEKGIITFQKLHYNERHASIEALKKQIQEAQDFLVGEKRNPLIGPDGKIVTNADGEEIYTTDLPAMKFAFDAAGRLPELHEALEKLQAKNKEVDTTFEGETFTGADILPDDEEGEDDNVSEIEQYVQKKYS